MSNDTRLSKAQISKIIQSEGISGSWLYKLAHPLIKVAVHLAKKNSAPLATSAIDTGIQKKINGSGSWRF